MAFNLIKFKKGTLAGLNTLKESNSIEEGSFYLTIDEHKETSRLYIGTNTNTVLPVNSNITVVTNTTDLSSAHAANFNDGDFAYVTNGNILAVRFNSAWTQINAPDSRAIKDLTPSIATSNDVATITWTMRDQDNNVIKTSDQTPVVPAITMTGANGVKVSSANRNITITGTSYEMSSTAPISGSNSATLKLQSKDSASATAADVSSITITGGNNVTIGGTANDITITAADTTLTSTSLSTANNTTSGFNISIKDSSNNGNTATIDPKITLGTHTATTDQFSFVNGVANLPVYTKDEIDNINRSVNAMTYRGIVGAATGSVAQQPSGITDASIGDTYKLVGDSTVTYTVPISGGNTTTAHGGDVIIANGTEGTNGKITTGSLYFDVIPSGDEITKYKGLGTNHTGNGIQVEDGNNTIIASLEVAAGTQMAVSSTHSGDNGEKAKITVAHGSISSSTNGDANTPTTVSQAQTTHGTKTFDVVTGLTTNNGHVTGTTVERIQVTDTVSKLDATNTKVTVSTSNNASTVTHKIQLQDENNTLVNSKELQFILQSDNLAITSSGTTITANYVWEEF